MNPELPLSQRSTANGTSPAPRFADVSQEGNEIRNYHGPAHPVRSKRADAEARKAQSEVKKIVSKASYKDEVEVSRAIEIENEAHGRRNVKGEVFDPLRKKVRYADRAGYIRFVARLNNLNIYSKLEELRTCKTLWGTSSAALASVYRDLAVVLVHLHADDFVSHGSLFMSNLMEISKLCEVELSALIVELITAYTTSNVELPASVWMGLASTLCDEAGEGVGQTALARLLNSGAAKLAENVVDGPWKNGLYPKGDQIAVATAMIWYALGSPFAAYRWRAAHAVRCLAKLGRWEVIDKLVAKHGERDAHSFQAPELPFYYLHARLWLMIALARLSIDYPSRVDKYRRLLKAVALLDKRPHVLMRHFAAQAYLRSATATGGMSPAQAIKLRQVNLSPFPPAKPAAYGSGPAYLARPASMPEPVPNFSLDYDFEKYGVQGLATVFQRPKWEITDAITARVMEVDPSAKSMYDTGGRSNGETLRGVGMNSRWHGYGHQLGFHALEMVAAKALATYPVVEKSYTADPWREWMADEVLTRDDGQWLSDGTDRAPLDTQLNLLEKGASTAVITGSKKKILGLIGIFPSTAEIVVGGDWQSYDNIDVHISSALVAKHKARKVAQRLAKEDPFRVWLPAAEEWEDEDTGAEAEKEDCRPWIIWPSTEPRLDQTDPIGSRSAVRRLRFSKSINDTYSLAPIDGFGRVWQTGSGSTAARSEAWRYRTRDEQEFGSARRLVCETSLLRRLLAKEGSDLLLLIILRRYQSRGVSRGSEFWHTTAVVRVTSALKVKYFEGVVNKRHENNY